MSSSVRFHKSLKFKILLIASLLITVVIWYCNFQITRASKGLTFDSIESMPVFSTGLLLGTSRQLSNGQINEYWSNRIDAAELLLKTGRIRHLVISGDNSTSQYDEPTEMRNALIERGIDSTRITLDYAGFRTLDSVVRLREVFQQDTALIISQKFHNERALYIASYSRVNAWGFNAKDVAAQYGFKTQCREILARVKAVLDRLFNVEPKFYGEKIHLPIH